MPKVINPRIFRLPGFVVISGVALLAVSGCTSDKEVGLCSYLGGCMESEDEDETGMGAPAASPVKRSDPGVTQDASGGGGGQ